MRLTPASNKRISPVSSKHVYPQKKNLLAIFKSSNVRFFCYKIFFCGNHWCLRSQTNSNVQENDLQFNRFNIKTDLLILLLAPSPLPSCAAMPCGYTPVSISLPWDQLVLKFHQQSSLHLCPQYDAAILNPHIWLTNGNSSRSNSAN